MNVRRSAQGKQELAEQLVACKKCHVEIMELVDAQILRG